MCLYIKKRECVNSDFVRGIWFVQPTMFIGLFFSPVLIVLFVFCLFFYIFIIYMYIFSYTNLTNIYNYLTICILHWPHFFLFLFLFSTVCWLCLCSFCLFFKIFICIYTVILTQHILTIFSQLLRCQFFKDQNKIVK